MKILVLGGTQFVGRHVVEMLIERGDEVILANRGKTAPELFPDLKKIIGERGSLDFLNRLKQEQFDAIVDFCAYFPDDIRKLLPLLSELTNHYVQISSISAYRSTGGESIPYLRDDAPLFDCSAEQAVDTTDSTYGQRKAKCDDLALSQSRTGTPATVFRPSLIYGKYDPTDRFAYWIWRVASKAPFLLPDDGLCITRRTYAPDFATAIVQSLGTKTLFHQAYNFAESEPLSLRATLKIIGDVLGVDPMARAVPVSTKQLRELGVRPWADLPLWIPQTHLIMEGCKIRRHLTLMETKAADAIRAACEAFLSLDRAPKAGLSTQVEAELINKLG